ncbi:MAG: ImmA/IrrE family metallo-endopeptidase [Betaproteobacteria bacterium]|nr:ImmA/IrrE family metallo-endopeptidase [Betaproteobacteria bacterium]
MDFPHAPQGLLRRRTETWKLLLFSLVGFLQFLEWVGDSTFRARFISKFPDQASVGLVILVNDSHARARRRFSYAHEYAHALFDRTRPVTLTSADNAAELIEKRANVFAAAFLLPREGVIEVNSHVDRELRTQVTRLAIEAYRREEISRGRLLDLGKQLGIPGPKLVALAEAARTE